MENGKEKRERRTRIEIAIGLAVVARLFAILAGAGVTALVQSSSATSVMTVGFVNAGLLSLEQAIGVIFGANVGTTVTAALAAIGTNVHAKRTALAHTLFNVVNVVVLSFFIPALARLCTAIIPGKDGAHARALEPKLLATPSLALQATALALADMTRRAWTVASVALNGCLGKATVGLDAVEAAEREIDATQTEIKAYLVAVSQRRLTTREAQMIPELIHCVNDAERISDLALRVYRKSSRGKGSFADSAVRSDVAQVASLVRAFAHATIRTVRSGDGGAFDARTAEQNIRTAIRRITRDSWADPRARGEQAGEAFAVLAVFSCLRDISRHLGNIAVRAPALR